MIFQATGRRGSTHGYRTRLRLRGGRAWLLGGLLLSAAALQSSISVLLVIMALLVLVDSAVPVPGQKWVQADARFRQLVRSRRNAGVMPICWNRS